MSRLQVLIDELCPGGVIRFPLEELVSLQRGSNPNVVSDSDGYPVVTAGRTVLTHASGFNSPAQMISISSHGAYAGFVSYWPEPVWLANNVFGFNVRNQSTLLPAFLYYYLKSRESETSGTAKGGGVPYINAGDLLRLLVPVPPLEVQKEIVRILDTFSDLEADLELELEARKKQQEHYLGRLLSPDWESGRPKALSKLISQSCPEGVPTRELGQVISYEQPTKYLVASSDYSDSHQTPVLTAGKTFILGYTEEAENLYPASPSNPVIIFDDFTTAFKWVDFPFKAKSSAMKMLRPKVAEEVNLRFVYFSMQLIRYETFDHARQWISTYSKLEISLPPVHVQDEIVLTLDAFDSLLEETNKEIAARKVQLAYYRDKLLTFKEAD